MDIQKLLEEYSVSRDPGIKERIVLKYLPFAYSLSKKYYFLKNDYEDIKQVAVMGLIKAVDNFDPSKKAAFATYANHCITGEISHFIRDKITDIKNSTQINTLLKNMDAFIDEYIQKHHRFPSMKDLSEKFSISAYDISFYFNMKKHKNKFEADEETDIFDHNYESFRLAIDDKITVMQAVEKLRNFEKKLIYMFFFMDLSQMEIEKKIGISQRQISRLIQSTLKKLRSIIGKIEK